MKLSINIVPVDTDWLLKAPLRYGSEGAAGFDLPVYALLTDKPGSPAVPWRHDKERGEHQLIPARSQVLLRTGYRFEIPQGYELQIRSRSGLGLKGICIAHGMGTVDCDYRGEVHIPIYNRTDTPFIFSKGDRMAQAVIAPVVRGIFRVVSALSETKRGTHGHGSTGLKGAA